MIIFNSICVIYINILKKKYKPSINNTYTFKDRQFYNKYSIYPIRNNLVSLFDNKREFYCDYKVFDISLIWKAITYET